LLQERPRELLAFLGRQAAGFTRKPVSLQQLILVLQRTGLPTFAALAAEALWVEEHGERPGLPVEVRSKLDQLRSRGKAATFAERLDAYRAVRAARILPWTASMFIIAMTLEDESFDRLGDVPEIERLSARIREREAAYGLKDGETWLIGEAPDDVEALRNEWDAVAYRTKVAFFRSHGEVEIADLMERERALYERLLELGRGHFFGGEVLSVLLQ